MEKTRIDSIFTKGRSLEIPFFQRSYVWSEENWDRRYGKRMYKQ